MRHSILANRIDFEHKSGLVLDARSITQLLYMHSIIGDRFSKESTILLWKGRKSDLLLTSKLIDLPKNYYILDIDSRDKALMFDFKTIKNIMNNFSLELESNKPTLFNNILFTLALI